MAHVQLHDDLSLDDPYLVEGLPGAGLVGKIAADHIVETFDMPQVGAVHCDGLPEVAVYHGEDSDVLAPVRLYASEEHDLLVLQSDVPVSPKSASDFAGCVTNWLRDNDVMPIYLSGLPDEKEGVPEVYGIATGNAERILEEVGLVPPRQGGLVSGPTGALLYRSARAGLDAVGLVVETEARFPDPEASRAVIDNGIEPLTGVTIDTDELVEHAEDIRQAREQLAQQMQQADDESSEAQPIRGFQ